MLLFADIWDLARRGHTRRAGQPDRNRPKPRGASRQAPIQTPNVNLQGFPLPYRQGYADGCASINGAEHKDATRFKNDGQYRTGWQDGNALCKKR